MKKEEKKSKMPTGMIIILLLLFILVLVTLFALTNPISLFGINISGIFSIIFNLIFLAILILIIIGIFKRDLRARKLALIYLGLMMLNGIVNVIISFVSPSESLSSNLSQLGSAPVQTAFIISFVISVILILIIEINVFIYLYKKKDYFNRKLKKKTKKRIVGLKGLLIPVIIYLFIATLLSLLFSLSFLSSLVIYGFSNYALFSLLAELIILFLLICSIVLVFKRKKKFKILAEMSLILFALISFLGAGEAIYFYYSLSVLSIICVVYLFISKRVKNTFVK